MITLLLPIFAFGVVVSWVVYLGVQQANESTLARQRIPVTRQQEAERAGVPPAIAQRR